MSLRSGTATPMVRSRWLPLLALTVLLGVGRMLAPLEAAETSGKRRILTTFAPIHSWTLNVAGEDATVELLLPGDVGPHDFQLRPQDLRKIRQADLLIANGLGMEGWLEKAIQGNAKESARKIVRTADGLKQELIYHLPTLSLDPATARQGGHEHGHDHDHEAAGEAPNPHVWLDPVYAQHAVSNIITALSDSDPAHATGYKDRGLAYIRRLQQLDHDIRTRLTGITNRTIVTYHDAFPYFCRRYGIDLAGVVEEVPSVEPSPKYLANLSAVIRARNVRVIFTEPQFNPRLVRQISRDLKIRFAELDVLETGKPGPGFYEEGMRRNLQALDTSLR
jgi:zinc transport system substrate-binding protein